MKKLFQMRSLQAVRAAALLVVLLWSMFPAQTAGAQTPSASDLAISLVSIPKHARACQTFEAVYRIANLGPDPVAYLDLLVSIPDAYDVEQIWGLPQTLAVGQTETITVVIKVVAFVPGEMRRAWVGVTLIAENVSAPNSDPVPGNNAVRSSMRLIGKPSRAWCA
jgi:hypothetical protein